MDPDIKAQIETQIEALSGVKIGALIFDEAPIEFLAEYFAYNNVFSEVNAAELLENIGMNEQTIKLEKITQPFFGPIYSLGSVELKMLKTYIETNQANGFFWPFKSPAGAPILFDQKSVRSFRL